MTQGPGGEDTPAKPEAKKKVAKTLLFNSPEIDAGAVENTAGATHGAIDPVSDLASQTALEEENNSVGVTKKRKVPKTLLELDKAQIMQAAEAAAKEQEQDLQKPPTEPAKTSRKIAKTILYDLPVSPGENEAGAAAEIDGKGQKEAISLSQSEEVIERPTKRRVAKTMLFNQVEDVPPPPAKEGYRSLSTKKIARTLLFTKPEVVLPTSAQLPADSTETAPISTETSSEAAVLDRVEAEKVVERYIARTMLDHSILFAQLAKTQHRQEEIAIEAAREKALEPIKPFVPVECKKNALPCPWVWDETLSTDKYRYCKQCQSPVYNFAGMEMPEAEALILKIENRSKFTLFKRTDGKFMTGDCPVAVKRKSDMILLSFGAVAAICCFLIYLTTLPKPKPAAPPPVVTKKAPAKVQLYTKTVPATPGSGHYVAGKGFVMDTPAPPSTATPPPVQTPAYTAPDPDENGQMWEYNTPPGASRR